MIISHAHKFIFLKTHKTGGTSVELALSLLCGESDVITPTHHHDVRPEAGRPPQHYVRPRSEWPVRDRILWRLGDQRLKDLRRAYLQHTPAAVVRERVGEAVWRAYFKFSIERNPWDREVSLYFWRTRNRRTKPSFEEFLRLPQRGRWHGPKLDNWSIYAIGDDVVADHIIRFEALADGFAEALNRIGVADPPPLPNAKSATRLDRKPYQEFYTPASRDLIASWYRREIDRFGFIF